MEKKMENEMETELLWDICIYWGYIGIMEKIMETTNVIEVKSLWMRKSRVWGLEEVDRSCLSQDP